MSDDKVSTAKKSESTESRNEKFCRIAEYRTNRIIDMIRLLGNCSNKSTYDYTPEQVEQIFRAISEATAEAKSKFTVKKEDKTFKLKRP
ncbi:hypothetical protein AR505_0337 [methanogenic archaeon ISO4-H5]|nr:hypothetical protein AR505_0337 [methanogenic archaeon ISO4-H5]